MAHAARLTGGEMRFRASPEDWKRLLWLAKEDESSAAQVVRRLIAREYAKRCAPSREGKNPSRVPTPKKT